MELRGRGWSIALGAREVGSRLLPRITKPAATRSTTRDAWWERAVAAFGGLCGLSGADET